MNATPSINATSVQAGMDILIEGKWYHIIKVIKSDLPWMRFFVLIECAGGFNFSLNKIHKFQVKQNEPTTR